MEPIAYLKALRRRWRIVAACVLVGLVAAWLTTPAKPQAGASLTTYKTTVTLVPPPEAASSVNLSLAAFLVTAGDVPRMAATSLRYQGDPRTLASTVNASSDQEIGSVSISATSPDRKRSVAVAEAFANATTKFLRQSTQKLRDDTAVEAQQQLNDITKRLDKLENEIAVASGTELAVLRAKQRTETIRYGLIYQRLQDLLQPINPRSDLQALGEPTTTATAAAGISAPNSRGGRALLLGGLGLLLGLIAGLVVDRLDVRLRTREAVEAAFGAPVVAEVPRTPAYLKRSGRVAVRADPAGGVAEAYRTLRSAVLLAPRPVPPVQRGDSVLLPGGPQVILVAGARSREGKTTTVANLAAALAEAERSVLVLDCDLRKPEVHRQLDVAPSLGLSEIVGAEGSHPLQNVIRPTGVRGVSIVTAGRTAPENPAPVLLRIGAVIQEARRHADIVLIDSAPMLVANDTNDVLQHVDAVVLCARVGHVSAEQAGRVRQLLTRASKPVIGVALIGVPTPLNLHSRGTSSALATPRLRQRIPFLVPGGESENGRQESSRRARDPEADGTR